MLLREKCLEVTSKLGGHVVGFICGLQSVLKAYQSFKTRVSKAFPDLEFFALLRKMATKVVFRGLFWAFWVPHCLERNVWR